MIISKEGLYLLNKPRGRSSFSVVAQVRRQSGIKKVGHAGTLDPQAEGLLVVLVGKEFTKKAENYSKLDKVYEFEVELGKNSTTDDIEGEIAAVSDIKPTIEQVIEAIEQIKSLKTQRPPVYSAIKVGGVRAYKLAREGQEPDLAERKIKIYSIELISYKYPRLIIRAEVSSGTYIRSIARKLGEILGTGAYCTMIKRTRIGSMSLDDALDVD